ncbi:Phosphoribosylaminoimidazole-succinocarboxamide synthase [Neolecta irregularis DAH-3]|uniref:Phosphoribosylaminoimidazole-succinocarboxamide synthase n=1 Tax=Neolecta irregularis (strain DAH-3) TaxID=1198029 RepID=A0A1U7LU71_NEOID|nr:Phosphoribosylaminoimidazole-succinocarboxamide synthase [Neolecta irregularis DAH-3]|eukprot:OLL26194.1 Phosphoribosylaminoimidazole-succinocarboxamide synthase [Neolecta irregularis DAH-3]
MSLTVSSIPAYPLLARGKVRDIYKVDDDTLLLVATDRISAYDIVMRNGIPEKGKILSCLSEFWLSYLKDICPNHYITCNIEQMPAPLNEYTDQLSGRSMLVKQFKVLPIEAIVRGYITGSAWKEYQKTGTVHGIKMPGNMQECQALEQPIYTPSTKAEHGQHDVNINPDQVISIIGEKYARQVETLSTELYIKARNYAMTRGIIIADTKFEFGVDEQDNIVLIDEVLTPGTYFAIAPADHADSSRFWEKDEYKVGMSQESYDKQFLRDWLTKNGLEGKENVILPDEIIQKTRAKYVKAYERLTGQPWF